MRSDLPVGLVRLCVAYGIIRPLLRDGIPVFAENDLLMLKVVRFLMRAAQLFERMEHCRRQIGYPPLQQAPHPAAGGWIGQVQAMLRGYAGPLNHN